MTVCAVCKRDLPKEKLEDDRARCKDRQDCTSAMVDWLGKETFVDRSRDIQRDSSR